ncbi:unnamed protein product [Rhizoctonia solani]|uniref:Uncharacterized protein n=1 Tax=Rhizoctonia solani TaxID=456999 RepID=A0A8H3HXN8_9AGAM|nr:unnamed protein product [Rhizoctonia solani]
MLRRWDRIQHAIIESFASRGTRPTPIWNLYELEPDGEQRAYLQRKITRLGATEHDFLRWRNACVAYSLPESLNALRTLDGSGAAPMPTPLWVISHLLRRKVHSSYHASIAVHLALVAVPNIGPLVSEYEQPLLLALEAATRYNSIHALPALTSRILDLPIKHHAKLLETLCKRDLPPTPLAAAALQIVLEDINSRSILLSNQTWQSVWEKWVVLHPLGDEFAAALGLQIKDQGFQAPRYNPARSKSYTQSATYFPERMSLSRQDPALAALTAAAHSKQVSARLLMGVASTLADGFFASHPNQARKNTSTPSVTFLTALILGLIRKGAYSRAVGVWKNAQTSKSKFHVTPMLLEAAVSAHILNRDLGEAVRLLDMYAKPRETSKIATADQEGGIQLPSKVISLLISHLPSSSQGLVFGQAYKRWCIQPDSNALEVVMIGAVQAVAKHSKENLNLKSNVRELKEGIKNLFRRTPVQTESLEQSILSPGPFNKEYAIRLFRNVLLRNWPFIQGVEQGYWEGLLEKQAIDLFIPTPLTVRRSVTGGTDNDEDPQLRPSFEFTPSPLHPSPTPSYPHACPTRRAWTAYLLLLDPNELPQALGWMRTVDESLRARSNTTSNLLELFRPEREAMIDVLMRWEDFVLAGETPVGRAWEERQKGAVGGVGREGALRTWMIEWLGEEYVPNRSEIARARVKMKH